jgi:hypothetical protein
MAVSSYTKLQAITVRIEANARKDVVGDVARDTLDSTSVPRSVYS